jgi:hypothetical protein
MFYCSFVSQGFEDISVDTVFLLFKILILMLNNKYIRTTTTNFDQIPLLPGLNILCARETITHR